MNRGLLRWIALGLLLVNMLYFFWPQLQPAAPTRATDVARLTLFETPDDTAALATPPVNALDPEAEPKPEPALPEAPVAVGSTVCWELGPLPEEAVKPLSELIDEQPLAARIVEKRTQSEPVYRVYMRPDENRLELRRQLKTLKIDNFEVATGELRGALSLGIFSTRARAESFVDHLANARLVANIHEQSKYPGEYWLQGPDNLAEANGWGRNFEAFPYQIARRVAMDSCPE